MIRSKSAIFAKPQHWVLSTANETLKTKSRKKSDHMYLKANFTYYVFYGKGKRYTKSIHDFTKPFSSLGDPKILKFVAMNIGGPDIDTVYYWRGQQGLALKP